MNKHTKAAYNKLHSVFAGHKIDEIKRKSNWSSADQKVAEANGLGTAIEQRRARKAAARRSEKAKRASRARNR